MHGLILDLEKDYKKTAVVAVRSGDTVKVTQRIREANKERLQMFEGLIIRVDRANSLTCRITVRKITSGVGVEKSFLVHSPNVVKLEVVKRAKVRRNYLSYMRQRVGKSARLRGVDFDWDEVNKLPEAEAEEDLGETDDLPTESEEEDVTEKSEETEGDEEIENDDQSVETKKEEASSEDVDFEEEVVSEEDEVEEKNEADSTESEDASEDLEEDQEDSKSQS